MRISDWSSDVCSSDLAERCWRIAGHPSGACAGCAAAPAVFPASPSGTHPKGCRRSLVADRRVHGAERFRAAVMIVLHDHCGRDNRLPKRSEEHTSELQSLMRISYAVFCLKKKTTTIR